MSSSRGVGGGMSKDVTRWQRGVGVWNGPKKDDVIYEQPLTTTQPQHCSWVGREKDWANHPTQAHHKNSTKAFKSLRLTFIDHNKILCDHSQQAGPQQEYLQQQQQQHQHQQQNQQDLVFRVKLQLE